MDTETKARIEPYLVRGRGWIRLTVALAGLGLVALGAYNLLGAPLLEMQPVAPYRGVGVVSVGNKGVHYIGDVIVMAIGAILAWLA